MNAKLNIVKVNFWLRFSKKTTIIISVVVFWAFAITGALWPQPISDWITVFGSLCFILWIILLNYFSTEYKQIGVVFVRNNSIIIETDRLNVIINDYDIYQIIIYYKNFKKKYEGNGKSIEAQMTSTRNINKIKIKSTKGIYNYHFYLDDSNYFDELYALVKTMAATGLDIKILEGNNFITKYIDEKI